MRTPFVLAPACLALLAAPLASRADAEPRHVVLISDTHMGIGKAEDGKWHPMEDFRWPVALRHFLDHASEASGDRTDLVIAGDFLELWQLPPEITCKGVSADYGCTVEEMVALVKIVPKQHPAEFADLARFAARGENHLHVIPGNHDATLVEPRVWEPVKKPLEARGAA